MERILIRGFKKSTFGAAIQNHGAAIGRSHERQFFFMERQSENHEP
jgi:hypothetical protein